MFFKNIAFVLMAGGSIATLVRAALLGGDLYAWLGGVFAGVLVATVGHELESRKLERAKQVLATEAMAAAIKAGSASVTVSSMTTQSDEEAK